MIERRCTCPSIDARDCLAQRTGTRQMLWLIGEVDDPHSELDAWERCECYCHDEYEAELRDLEDANAEAWERDNSS